MDIYKNKKLILILTLIGLSYQTYATTLLEQKAAKIELERIPAQIKEIDDRIKALKLEIEAKKDVNTKLKEELLITLTKERDGLGYELYQANEAAKGKSSSAIETKQITEINQVPVSTDVSQANMAKQQTITEQPIQPLQTPMLEPSPTGQVQNLAPAETQAIAAPTPSATPTPMPESVVTGQMQNLAPTGTQPIASPTATPSAIQAQTTITEPSATSQVQNLPAAGTQAMASPIAMPSATQPQTIMPEPSATGQMTNLPLVSPNTNPETSVASPGTSTKK